MGKFLFFLRDSDFGMVEVLGWLLRFLWEDFVGERVCSFELFWGVEWNWVGLFGGVEFLLCFVW